MGDSNFPLNPDQVKLGKLQTGFQSGLEEPDQLEGDVADEKPKNGEEKYISSLENI